MKVRGCIAVVAGTLALGAPASGGVQFYSDPGLFDGALPVGTAQKYFWAFKPDNLPNDGAAFIDDGLNIDTHAANAPGVWDPGFWPAAVDNITFSSNTTPPGFLTPRGAGGLLYVKADHPDSPLDNNGLLTSVAGDSFNLINDGSSVTAMALVPFGLDFAGGAPTLAVTVYDPAEQLIGQTLTSGFEYGQKFFLGLIATDGDLIGRVDIWDLNGGFEGISTVVAYVPAPGGLSLLALAALPVWRRRR